MNQKMKNTVETIIGTLIYGVLLLSLSGYLINYFGL